MKALRIVGESLLIFMVFGLVMGAVRGYTELLALAMLVAVGLNARRHFRQKR